jgi:hypothetical protein
MPDSDPVRWLLPQAIDLLWREWRSDQRKGGFSAALEKAKIQIVGAAFTDAAESENTFTLSPER